MLSAHPSTCGVYPLRDARNAFAARVLLARAAQRSLDLQYYIWHDDISGRLLFQALLDAAKRGVRVRLLLDDNDTSGLDTTLSVLDASPNVEVRLFNPFSVRNPRWLGYLTDFSRLNHRMHNKSFTADNQVAIVGGRNIGDEYFAANQAGPLFADLDIMAIGPVVREVSNQFDRYWASESSYPLDRLVPPATAARIAEVTSQLSGTVQHDAAAEYRAAIETLPFVHHVIDHTLAFEWAAVHTISDDPAKAAGRAARKSLLIEQMAHIFGEPKTEVDLVSPYFVPGRMGTEAFRRWSAHGVKIRILTNALEATDVAAVHAGYAKHRRDLLAAGVTLYELRRAARIPRTAAGPLGSSSASLHAKTFAVDGSRVFVGSFNFDPRSARLNTEMGFVIDSPPLAQEIGHAFDTTVPINAYEVHVAQSGKMYWSNGGSRYDSEPGTSIWRRGVVRIASRLPIEWLL